MPSQWCRGNRKLVRKIESPLIREYASYPTPNSSWKKISTWLANVVLVRKEANKWHICLDFTDMKTAYPKDSYPLLDIDHLIDESLFYYMLSFIGSYSRYNQIWMDPLDAPKTIFISNHCNYYYNVTPFGLKNTRATASYSWTLCSPTR